MGIAGKLYRYDPTTKACEVVDEGPFTASFQPDILPFTSSLRGQKDSNGLGWSPDEKTL